MILQAAVGPDGAWEFWMEVTDENRAKFERLAARKPAMWRIVEA